MKLTRRRLLAACGCGAPLILLGSQSAFAQECGNLLGVGSRSVFTKAVSAEQVEQAASLNYQQLKKEAGSKRALAPANHPQVVRLRAIAERIVPLAMECNPRARQWQWEVNLVGSNQINAFCMPGGKIAFYSGILENLRLDDDEVAMIMGHEIAHALQEHAREQMGKSMATRGAIEVGAALLGLGGGARLLGDLGGQLLSLKFGRDDETEADRVGLVLAARAGYDPRAGVTLWEKMAAANKGAPPQFLSTHPSSPSRIKDIQAALPKVAPLYERAAKPPQRFQPAVPRTSEAPAKSN
ncbi:MAG: M48 family metallopeptidase [Burkholderiales bacterium]